MAEHEPLLPERLDPATLAVRDLLAGSREVLGRAAERMGMSVNDMSAVGELVQHGPLGASELARRLGIRTASVTSMIDRLEAAGLVERVRDPLDRRRVTVVVTDAARSASLQAWGPVVRRIDEYCTTLSATERETVVAFFARITAIVGDAS